MKIRNGFVSNSSSSSFVLKRLPEDVNTIEKVYDFYGMGKGKSVLWSFALERPDIETEEFCKYILKENEKVKNKQQPNEERWIISGYFIKNKVDEFFKYYGFGFRNGYGLSTIEDICKNPDDYFEIVVDDTFISGPGCASGGSYITKNGVEVNCH